MIETVSLSRAEALTFDEQYDRRSKGNRPVTALRTNIERTGRSRARSAAALFRLAHVHARAPAECRRFSFEASDLVAKLTAETERPWAEWKHGRPLTQKQLAGLLAPFHIISLTVHPPGLPDGKGYRRSRTASAWPCPSTRLRASRFDESLHCSEGDGINGRRRQAFLASFGQLDRIFITTYSCILSCIEATTAFCRSRAKRRQHRKFRT
jgi:hypothetical protein